MNTCNTCKFWGDSIPHLSKSTIKECWRVDTDTKQSNADKANGTTFEMDITVDDYSNLRYELMTGENFGCIHYQPKAGLNEPYLLTTEIQVNRNYNPKFGDDKICECGHPYYRHFDTYENMEACGCKYCKCDNFKEKTK